MLAGVIMGVGRSGSGRGAMRSRTLRYRRRKVSRLRSLALVLWKPVGLGGTMVITRNPRKDGEVRISHIRHSSRISGGFRAFPGPRTRTAYISRLFWDYTLGGQE